MHRSPSSSLQSQLLLKQIQPSLQQTASCPPESISMHKTHNKNNITPSPPIPIPISIPIPIPIPIPLSTGVTEEPLSTRIDSPAASTALVDEYEQEQESTCSTHSSMASLITEESSDDIEEEESEINAHPKYHMVFNDVIPIDDDGADNDIDKQLQEDICVEIDNGGDNDDYDYELSNVTLQHKNKLNASGSLDYYRQGGKSSVRNKCELLLHGLQLSPSLIKRIFSGQSYDRQYFNDHVYEQLRKELDG